MKKHTTKHIAAFLLGAAVFAGSSVVYAGEIPVDRIILSTSGLAQFEHRTKVTGNAALEFPVRLEQVDDILKSLVVFDAKGRVGGVTLPGKQPLDQIFKDLPFDRKQLTSSMMLLNAYQGAVVTAKGTGIEMTGKVIQVTPEAVTLDNNKTVTRHRLSLMTAAGMKQAVLEDLQSLQFADAKVRDEISRALDSIRSNSTSGQRVLTVNLLGGGTRPVALSYVVAAPLWKAAYRMVAPEPGKTKGFLQGWAVVENMTAGDWNNVDLSLVSGNPVTFRQALYQSYYVDRPEVPVQVFGLVLPRIDEGALPNQTDMQQEKGAQLQRGKMLRAEGFAAPSAMAVQADAMAVDESFMATGGMGSVAGAAAPVQSAEAATQVLFRFPERLNLKSGQSMMLPFVSRDVPMERVSLYQPDTNPRHPLAAVEIKNDGETSLPPGVLTLYEDSKLLKGSSFAGDAQLPELGQGEKRLVSYALDSKTTIDREDKSVSTEGQMTAERGVIKTAVKNRAETTYTIKAPAREDRTVIIEHPRSGDYRLVEPDPQAVEVTETHYRIKTTVKAGETKPLHVVLESQVWQSYSIDTLSAEQLDAYAGGYGSLKPETRKQFEDIAVLRRELDETDQKISAVEEQRQAIFQDQGRVRENLKSLGVKSEVQQKYLDKLNAQEDQVAQLDKQKQALSEQRREKLEALQEKIAALKF
ncbi:MAG: DUF4139 domain-containing protein [Alphaproteobacteria bacterium]|nr:DUF4139 domain-containing protein [Alphaproteobacteria bacterium]